ncbi:acyltransferase family protein [Novosphingobium sp.]|uniref:acyltransferase family protein n=1 Tax=Novosphingobium sp. TaxID=1874826 RepID=UPI0038B75490
MNRNLSVYLDLLRLIAAVGVFLGHGRRLLMPTLPVVIGGNASQCVAIFFVLSGFVIAFVTDQKERDWQSYARARVLRMYSVTIVAFAVTLIADRIGFSAHPEVYAQLDGFQLHPDAAALISYFGFVNQIWWNNSWIGSNQAYWSLGYEVPYYAIFGVFLFSPARWRWLATTLVCLAIGPRVIAYLPLWLFGVWTFKYVQQLQQRSGSQRDQRLGLMLLAGSLFAYLLFRFVPRIPINNIYQFDSLGSFAISMVHFHVVGVFVVINIIGFVLFSNGRELWGRSIEQRIRWLAGGSFTLYLVHEPLMIAFSALVPTVKTAAILGIGGLAAVATIAYLVAELGERRKRLLNRLFPARAI